ncbi:MAG: DUF2062 domain-containing protein [Rhodobacteraceae bacterium]|nr:DUF2062 domain-containing protein [Paracoccaceae bacterium]
MVFKRRDKRPPLQILQHWVYPPGGWRRAVSYLTHRVRRLPDPPSRIARGLAAGIFVSFSPFFGFHFILAGLVAWMIRGNIVAGLLATLIGNPVTFPFVAAMSLGVGDFLFGMESSVPLPRVLKAFSAAAGQITGNLVSMMTGGTAHWDRLSLFFEGVFLPYLVGGTISGLAAAAATFYLTRPVIEAYQRRRANAVSAGAKRRRVKADAASHTGAAK